MYMNNVLDYLNDQIVSIIIMLIFPFKIIKNNSNNKKISLALFHSPSIVSV